MLNKKELIRYDRKIMIFGENVQEKLKKNKSSYCRIRRVGITYQYIFNSSRDWVLIFNR